MNNDKCVTILISVTLAVAVALFIVCTKEIIKGVKIIKLGENIFCLFENDVAKFI